MNADARPGASVARPKFQLVSIAEIDFFRGSPDLVRGLLPRSGLGVIFGPSGCGKSFLALDVALHVAMGRAWAFQRREQVIAGLALLVDHDWLADLTVQTRGRPRTEYHINPKAKP